MTSFLTRRPSVRRLLGRAGLEKSALSPRAVAEVATRAYARGVPDERMDKFVGHARRWNKTMQDRQRAAWSSPAGRPLPASAYQVIPGFEPHNPGVVAEMLRPEITAHLYGGFRGAPPAHEPVAVTRILDPEKSQFVAVHQDGLAAQARAHPGTGFPVLHARSQQLPHPGPGGFRTIVDSINHPLFLGHELGHTASIDPLLRLHESFRQRGLPENSPRLQRFREWLGNRQLLANQDTLRQHFADVGMSLPDPEALRQWTRLQTEAGYHRPELTTALNQLRELRSAKVPRFRELPDEIRRPLRQLSRPYRNLLTAAMTVPTVKPPSRNPLVRATRAARSFLTRR